MSRWWALSGFGSSSIAGLLQQEENLRRWWNRLNGNGSPLGAGQGSIFSENTQGSHALQPGRSGSFFCALVERLQQGMLEKLASSFLHAAS